MFVAATVESSETTESLWNCVKKKPGAPHFLFLSLHHGKTEVVVWKRANGDLVGGKKEKCETQIYGLLAMLNYCKVSAYSCICQKEKKEWEKTNLSWSSTKTCSKDKMTRYYNVMNKQPHNNN